MSILEYSDANRARCVDTRRFTYGYSIVLVRNLVSWSAKKQPTVARSNCESEYRALANTVAEVVWLANLLRELRFLITAQPVLLCDNYSAAFLSQKPVSHKRAKHIDIDCHFIRDLVSAGKLSTKFRTLSSLADRHYHQKSTASNCQVSPIQALRLLPSHAMLEGSVKNKL